MTDRIPHAVALVVGSILGMHYYSHRRLNVLFTECGAPGEPPEGNCQVKCTSWLKRCSDDPSVDALGVLGRVLEEFMELSTPLYPQTLETLEKERARVKDILQRSGLSYHTGGRIHGATRGLASRSLEDILRSRDLAAIQLEFERALEAVETDPSSALTAACAIIEATCSVYIEDEGLALPSTLTVKPLWDVVQKHLGLHPAKIEDDDIRRILGGLSAIVDGLGAFRTHAGSAHGRGRAPYKVAPRHSRLALNAAHTLVTFLLETWSARRSAGAG